MSILTLSPSLINKGTLIFAPVSVVAGLNVLVAVLPFIPGSVCAISKITSNFVIILPNNKNAIPAAIQAAEISQKDVRVVETVSMIQGVSSMFSFDKDLDIDSSVELMKNSITETQYGEISISERSAKFDDLSVLEGEFIGFLNGKLLSSEKSIAKVFDKLIECSDVQELELVTLYCGVDFSTDESEKLISYLKQTWENLDFELVRGEQPHYHLKNSMNLLCPF